MPPRSLIQKTLLLGQALTEVMNLLGLLLPTIAGTPHGGKQRQCRIT